MAGVPQNKWQKLLFSTISLSTDIQNREVQTANQKLYYVRQLADFTVVFCQQLQNGVFLSGTCGVIVFMKRVQDDAF